MASFNKVILVGNLTRDPEVRYLQSGMAVADIGLAVNDKRKNQQGEWVDETTFVDVTLWARQAEVAGEYLTKGAPVLIEGRLKLDTWESKEGEKRSKLKVVGENMRMLGGKGGGGGGGGGGQRQASGNRGASGGAAGGGFDDGDYGSPPEGYSGGGGGGRGNRAQPPADDIPF